MRDVETDRMSAEPTTRARDLQRARKLLAIAKSPNDNEARTAAVARAWLARPPPAR